ncbi:MAG TPA: hypothetical protein VN969_03500 [Streptosporangiaceae bacterium]|nr:hypothetical protein [Streptosporangiaceae bacterium]
MGTGMDLLLLAIDPVSGETRFGPRLSYALPVAELADAALALLAEHKWPLDVPLRVKWRGPRRIDQYLQAAVDAGVVHVVNVGSPERKLLSVDDAERIRSVTRKLIAVLDEPEPAFADVAFAVLADAADLDPRTIDQQIGLTPAARSAARFLGGGPV